MDYRIMNENKRKNIEIAKKVWEYYLLGMTKSDIAKKLSVHRSEVIAIIKFTTHTIYLSNNESEKMINELKEEKNTLLEELKIWKYSHFDAYIKGNKTGNKLTYKRLSEIREEKILELESTGLSILRKKIL